MKIVHLGKYYHPATGGVETHVRTLARGQAELGNVVKVVVVNHRSISGVDVTHRAIAKTRASDERDGGVQVLRAGKFASVAKCDVTTGLTKLIRRLQREGVDVWHLHAPNVTMLFALIRLRLTAPLVITHHSDVVKQKILYRLVAPFEDWAYRKAKLILSDSPGYIGGSPILNRYLDKVEVLPLGLDLKPFLNPSEHALKAEAAFRARWSGPIWLSVGRLIYYKGLHIAIKALRNVEGNLIIVGVGPLEQTLRELAEKEQVAHRCHFLGSIGGDELVGAYRAATALWFPSTARSEGFGQVQVEAMAAGCPVINTSIRFSGVDWVSINGLTGITIPINDEIALAEASEKIIQQDGLREKFANSAKERAQSEFSDHVMTARSLSLYDQVSYPTTDDGDRQQVGHQTSEY